MNKHILTAIAMMFALSACTGTADTWYQFDKGVLEPKSDKAYDVAINQLCALPLDIQLRAVRRKTIPMDALIKMCPDWKSARDAMIGDSMERLGIGYRDTRVH